MSFEVSDVEDWLVKHSETVERCLSCKAGSYDLFDGLRQTDCQDLQFPLRHTAGRLSHRHF